MKTKKDTIEEALERESLPVKAIERIEDVCIHVVDNTGKIVCYSKGCEKIENMKHEDVIGKDTHTLYNYVENESMQDYVLKTGKKVQDVHVKYESPSGKLADVISSTYPVFSTDGQKNVEAAICIYRDISDYMHMAKTIDKLQNDLKNQQLKDNGTQFTFKDVVGSSVATLECVRQGKIAAQTNAPILLAGPTGTGKEVFAQSIHNDSSRAHNPFVAINCSAIPENLLESTLFGTVKGSFTGAVDAKGLLETAKGGTLFLDEINSMNMTLQSKLLRVLQENQFYRVGGTKQINVNVRVICANNIPLMRLVETGRFREDLYYRLNICKINVPPLRDRKEDIYVLTKEFLSRYNKKYGVLKEIDENGYAALQSYDWPGNVRELENTVHRIVVSSKENMISGLDIESLLNQNIYEDNILDAKGKFRRDGKLNFDRVMEDQEKKLISYALKKEGTTRKAADSLGITQAKLMRIKKKYQL